MNVTKTVASKKALRNLCEKVGISIPESYGARDHFVSLMEANVPFKVKLEGLSYYEQYVVAAHQK